MSGIVRERVGSLYMFTSFPDESLLIGYSAVLDKETQVQFSVWKFVLLSLFSHTVYGLNLKCKKHFALQPCWRVFVLL